MLVSLSWTDTNGGQAETRVERSVNGGPFLYAFQVAAGVRSGEDTQALQGIEYRYRVRAERAGEFSPFTEPVSVTTPLELPGAPYVATAQWVDTSYILLAWSGGSGVIAGYRIERSVNSGAMQPLDQVSAGTYTYADPTIQPGNTYRYALRAFNAAGDSPRAFTPSVTVALLPPDAPLGPSLELLSSRAFRVTWGDVSNNETGFKLLRKTGNGAYQLLDTLPADSTAYDDTVQPSTAYTYRVVAYNAGGDAVPATSATVTTPKDGKLVVTPARLAFPVTRLGRTAKKGLQSRTRARVRCASGSGPSPPRSPARTRSRMPSYWRHGLRAS